VLSISIQQTSCHSPGRSKIACPAAQSAAFGTTTVRAARSMHRLSTPSLRCRPRRHRKSSRNAREYGDSRLRARFSSVLDTGRAISRRVMRKQRILVVGNGMPGLEAANALGNPGLETHVVEFAPQPTPQQG
jgi:heterodisulfide reductase subunit A-like polyferredoxin